MDLPLLFLIGIILTNDRFNIETYFGFFHHILCILHQCLRKPCRGHSSLRTHWQTHTDNDTNRHSCPAGCHC